ncbi:MAG: trigger factor, partial [Puniceicoccales bacterium]|nr:trigger factor [Puniceicoccales bacterium]
MALLHLVYFRNNVETDIQDISEVRKIATIRCDPQQIQIEEDLLLKVLCKDVNIPGFRKGKVPREIVKRQFANELQNRLQQKLVQSSYENLLKEKQWKVFSVIAVDVQKEDGFQVTFTIDLRPEVTLEDYRHFSLTSFPISVNDEEIERSIEQLRRQNAEYQKVDRPAQKGDFVRLNYKGILEDGREISKVVERLPILGEQRNTWEEAGAEETVGVRCIIEALVGLKAEDTKVVETDFSTEFEASELAGQHATYNIEILEVREQILPEVDPDFLHKVNAENLEGLKEKLSQDIHAYKTRQRYSAQRDELIRLLLDKVSFSIPESAVIAEQERFLRSFTEQQPQHIIASPKFKESQKEFFENAATPARQRAALNFILEYVAKKENIEVTPEDMQRLLIQDATAMRIS